MRIAKAVAAVPLGLSFLLGSCQPTATPPPRDVSSMLSGTDTPSAEPTSTNPPQPPATPTAEFQRLSPASIMRMVQSEVTIEASLFARESCLKFEIRVSGFQWGPGVPRESRLIKQVAFLDQDTGAPLPVEQLLQGGGGSGGEGVPVTMGESFIYDVQSSVLPPRVAAVVTFHEALGISLPVQFDLQPTARPNMYCPQLPPTTPEA